MKVIKELLNLFRKEATEQLLKFLKEHGNYINVYGFSDTPSITAPEGVCTLDNIELMESVGTTRVYLCYSDEYTNYETEIGNICVEELVSLVEWLEENADAIDTGCEDKAVELLAEAYYDIFGEEDGQIFKVDDLNIKTDAGTQIMKVEGWNGSAFGLLDENGTDVWDKIKSGEKSRIATEIFYQIKKDN